MSVVLGLQPSQSRNYLLRILFSFVLIVFVLDMLWLQYRSNRANEADKLWQHAFFTVLEPLLDQPKVLAPVVAELKRTTGIEVRIESLDRVHLQGIQAEQLNQATPIVINRQLHWLRVYPDTGQQVLIGPLPLRERGWPALAFTCGFYLCVALWIWLWLRPLMRGLHNLAVAARRFAKDYKAPLLPVEAPPPVQELADNFNAMAEQIRGLLEAQRELTGGLSHELRTPLARIKFAVATARRQLESSDQTAFDGIEYDIAEMEVLITAMLDYCRLQHLEQIPQQGRIDAKLFCEKLLALQYRSESNHIALGTSIKVSAIHGDARLLQLALSNLLINALRYAATQVRVECRFENGRHMLSVSDDGPGITDQDQSRLRQPFVKDTVRGKCSPGFGLGLSIVERVAILHGGQLILRRSRLGGLKAIVSWPSPDALSAG